MCEREVCERNKESGSIETIMLALNGPSACPHNPDDSEDGHHNAESHGCDELWRDLYGWGR